MSGDEGLDHLVHYFATCGLSSDRTPTKDHGEDGEPLTPLESSYAPATLCHFPESRLDVTYDSIAVTYLAVPNGIHFYTASFLPESPKLHCFLITQEDGQQLYGTALEMYQKVVNEDDLMFISTLQFMWKMSNDDPKKDSGLWWDGEEDLYVSKVLVLLLCGPYPNFGLDFLAQILAASQLETGKVLVESHLQFILDVENVTPGHCLTFQGPMAPVSCTHPHVFDVPVMDFHISQLFRTFCLDDILKIVGLMLLEHQVLLVSTELHSLTATAECLRALLFPFEWQHVFAPILPSQQLDLLDAPVPFVMGLQVTNKDRASRVDFDLSDEVLLVNVDAGSIDVPAGCSEMQLPEGRSLLRQLSRIADYARTYRFKLHNAKSYLLADLLSPVVPTNGLFGADMTLNSQSSVQSCPVEMSNDRVFIKPIDIPPMRRLTDVPEGMSMSTDSSVDIVISPSSENQVYSSFPRPELAKVFCEAHEAHQKELRINCSIQEAFSKYFQTLLYDYHIYMVDDSTDMGACFDSVAFLSDRPAVHTKFYSQLLGTQAFIDFTESKAMVKVTPFRYGRKHFESCLEDGARTRLNNNRGSVSISFRRLVKQLVSKKPEDSNFLRCESPTSSAAALLKARTESLKAFRSESRSSSGSCRSLHGVVEQLVNNRAKSGPISHEQVVRHLLLEAKTRVKRLVLGKMGREGFMLSLGLDDSRSLLEQEEQTSVAALCDLLERMWSHGCNTRRKGTASQESTLWQHLCVYAEQHEYAETSLSGPTISTAPTRPRAGATRVTTLQLSSSSSIDAMDAAEKAVWDFCGRKEKSLQDQLVDNIKQVQGMSEIRSNNGYARAFIRLALERKTLSSYLETLLEDQSYLADTYRPYAFVRQEEYVEQLLAHLLSLTTVKLSSFVNSYLSAALVYTVVVLAKSPPAMTLQLFGFSGKQCSFDVPANTKYFQKKASNVGDLEGVLITSLERGQSIPSKVQEIFIVCEQNERCYGLDLKSWADLNDSSTKLLVCAKEVLSKRLQSAVAGTETTSDWSMSLIRTMSNASRVASLKTPVEKVDEGVHDESMLLENLASSVNLLAKNLDGVKTDAPLSLLDVLWGQSGIATRFLELLSHGLKQRILARSNRYVWDFIELAVTFNIDAQLSAKDVENWKLCRATVNQLSTIDSFGKHAKALLFVCKALNLKMLRPWFRLLHGSPANQKMYGNNAAIRCREVVQDISDLLGWCSTIELKLPPSIECLMNTRASKRLVTKPSMKRPFGFS